MAFLRARLPATVVWPRFRAGVDEFTCEPVGTAWAVHIAAGAERTAELFHELTDEMPGAVSLSITRARDGTVWRGDALALTDVRESVARLRAPITAVGGFEVSIYTADDQLALSAQLELYAYARSDRWRYLLQHRGFVEREAIADRRWARSTEDFVVSAEADAAIAATVERLGLKAG
jgi:hypothetical protein